LTDFIGHFLCWSDIQVDWLHRTLFVLIRYLFNTNNVLWSQSTWISDQHKQCLMKSVNLDIWSTQTMSYEVSQLGYLIQVDWLHRTVFVLIRYLSWLTSYDIVCVDQISKLTDFIGHCLCWSDIQVDWLHKTLFQHKQCHMKSVNLDIWSTQTLSYEVSQLGYLINTNNVLWSQSTWISDQHKQCLMKSVNLDIWSTQTMNITIQWYLINTNNFLTS
jgi:hypothetical protein